MEKNGIGGIVSAIRTPFQQFFKIEAAGGIVLLLCTVVALVWANSPWKEAYDHFFHTEIALEIGSFHLSHSLLHWINDGLMVIFFFVVGLEIKRELIAGELSSFKQASLPITAALGGMIFPALIYVFLNDNPDTISGWGIPMATDIAFSLGVLSLLGKRVPLSLKVFLVAFAIVDDLGAVLVIALFYSHDLHINFLLWGLGMFVLLVAFNKLKVRNMVYYAIIGIAMWFFFLESGVHPTIAGVLIAFTIPMRRKIGVNQFEKEMQIDLKPFGDAENNNGITLNGKQMHQIDHMKGLIYDVRSPLQILEHKLHGFVTFFIMPVFALGNAGVTFIGSSVGIFNPLSLQIELGLLIGKLVGITLFSWFACKIGLALLPRNVKWIHIMGLALLGGMGFTMSLFIGNLAFNDPSYLDPAKMGILVGSFTSGILGYFVLRSTLNNPAKTK